MTNPDFITWINDTATLLTAQLPLQSFQSAVNLAFSYVSNVGGWVADDQQNQNGPGAPANGASEEQAASDIASQQIANVYDLSFTANVTLRVQFGQQLGSGLDLSSASAAMQSDLTSFITTTINNAALPVRVEAVVSQTADAGRSLIGGETTADVRVSIAADAVGGDKIVDYKAGALKYATTINGLDDTWNIAAVYTQAGNPIVVIIVKYTDNAYETIDTANNTTYVFTVSPTTYQVVSGVILTTA